MTKILESKISQLSENYHDWDRIFQDLLDIYFGKIEVTDEHNIEICSKFQKILTPFWTSICKQPKQRILGNYLLNLIFSRSAKVPY